MTKLPENAYLDFLELPGRFFMKSLFLDEWRSEKPAIYDDQMNLTPRFLSDALSTLPERDENSFADYYINQFNRQLHSMTTVGTGRAMDRDLFDLYMPTIPDLNLERVPENEFNEEKLDPFFSSFHGTPIERELYEATERITALNKRRSDVIERSLSDFRWTVRVLLAAAWRGRRYTIVTGLPKLDSWLAEAQDALEEFTPPNGVADELINRKLISNMLRSRNPYDSIMGRSLHAQLLDETPLTTILGHDGFELKICESREEAIECLERFAATQDRYSQLDGIGESRDFLKPPEALMAEEKLANFKLLTGFGRWRP